MPIFHRKFTVPRFPQRKASSMSNLSQLNGSIRSVEFGLDYGNEVRTRLSGKSLVFQGGEWMIESVDGRGEDIGSTNHEAIQLKRNAHQLVEENNLLKLKIEILLDMLAETTAEVHLQENEIDNLRALLQKNFVASQNSPVASSGRGAVIAT